MVLFIAVVLVVVAVVAVVVVAVVVVVVVAVHVAGRKQVATGVAPINLTNHVHTKLKVHGQ